jgi:hypothetical protein
MLNKLLPRVMVSALVGTASLGMEAILPRAAMALSFNFSFTSIVSPFNGAGSVTGIIEGLTDNSTSAATSVRVLSNTAGFGIGEYIGITSNNSWTVLGGALQSYNFDSFGQNNFSPAVTDSALYLSNSGAFSPGTYAGLTNSPDTNYINSNSGLTFAAVPVPAPALLPGLVGMSLALLRKRQAKVVQAD